MHQPLAVVIHQPLQRMAESMAEIEQRAVALFGLVARHERCVCILTGHLLKDPETTLAYHEGTLAGVESRAANRPVTIAPTPEALARALGE